MYYYIILSNATIVLLSLILIGGIASLIREWIVHTNARYLSVKIAMIIDNKLTFIGVIHHELSHLLLALLTGAKITDVSLFETKDGKLGHVDMIPRGPFVLKSLQSALCGMAPILCGCTSLYLIYYYGLYKRQGIYDVWTLIWILLMMNIGYHMSMSRQDFKVALKGLWLAYIVIIGLVTFLNFDLEIYRGYLITIVTILLINVLVTLIIKIIVMIFER